MVLQSLVNAGMIYPVSPGSIDIPAEDFHPIPHSEVTYLHNTYISSWGENGGEN